MAWAKLPELGGMQVTVVGWPAEAATWSNGVPEASLSR